MAGSALPSDRLTPAEQIAALTQRIKILETDNSSLRSQLIKARQQRHDAHNQLRSVLARRREETAPED